MIRNIAKQVRKDYTVDVEKRLVSNNDVTNIKKKNYTIKR